MSALKGILRGLAISAPPWVLVAAVTPPLQAAKVDFVTDIGPVLKAKCGSCHGPDMQSGGLRLDSLDALRKGGQSGQVIVPGKSTDSLLVHRLLGQDGKPRMPMGFAPVPDETIAKIRAWIDQGAGGSGTTATHWAYLPPRRPPLPAVKTQGWTRNPIDSFVLARLEKEGLRPSLQAPKETLARRAALDLTGLPPTVPELEAFLADKRAGAYERYVDKLLASPHYGERMARIWLDLARYADTNGYEKDLPRQMWAWRDWVINAFNKNMPFDQFTIEQLAGDLLPSPTRDQLVATGFHRNSMLNDEGGIDPEEFRVVAVIDRVDTTAQTWLGTTLACAQCHNHKYDPLTQRDYYSFFAFFNQSEDNGRDPQPLLRLPSPDQARLFTQLESQIDALKRQLGAASAEATRKLPEWEATLARGWKIYKPEAKAASADLRVLEDSSILASGIDPEADQYTISVPLAEGSRLAGMRIEAIPDPSLPEKSSGRNGNGNFVLRHVDAKILRADGRETPVRFTSAKADFAQQDFNADSVIAPNGQGWAIAAFQPENRVLHQLVLGCGSAYPVAQGDRLVVSLTHSTKFPHHNLGRFRIAVTDDLSLATQIPPTAGIAAILAKACDARTDVERKQLTEFYKTVAPAIAEPNARLEALQKQHDELERKAPSVLVMRELAKPRPDRILKRGDFRTPGDPVSPAVPVVLGGKAPFANRLGLAKWLVDPKNPLTARVEVNRLWEQCFGRGIVATPEDFGSQGDRPTHPELLDWLATELIAKKWDVKALLREIVTSATYMQSAKVSPAMAKSDPYNTLLGRGPRFRMEAEGIRDIALAASGRLTPTIGGPSVMPPQPPGIWENSFSFYDTKERWKDAEGPERYRRGLYTYWRRTAPYPMALTFDLKSRDMCIAHRSRTNTPLQALDTLNDPVFVECAGALGASMAATGSVEQGISYGYLACLSRQPKPGESAVLQKLLRTSRLRYRADPKAAESLLKAARVKANPANAPELAAWTIVANTLLNLDEAVTKG